MKTAEDTGDTAQQHYGLYNMENIIPYPELQTKLCGYSDYSRKQTTTVCEIDTWDIFFIIVSKATYHELWPNRSIHDTTLSSLSLIRTHAHCKKIVSIAKKLLQ